MRRPFAIRGWRSAIVLAALDRAEEPCTLHALGDALGADHTTLHSILAWLEEVGLVRRDPIPIGIRGVGVRHGLFLYGLSTPACFILGLPLPIPGIRPKAASG